MISRTSIIDAKSNLRMTQDTLDRAYLRHQVVKIDNAMVYQILSKVFTDMKAFVYMKQRKPLQDGQAVYLDIHEHFLGPDHVVRQATGAHGKLQTPSMMVRERHGIGKRMSPSRTACHYGEPYRSWLMWYGQWHQGLPLTPRHQEH